MLANCEVTNDDVEHPDGENRNTSQCIKVGCKECKCDDSEADCMEEELKVSSS